MTERVLLTGVSGFVGSHILRHLLAHTDWEIVAPITFRHKGLPGRVASSICDHDDWVKRVSIIHCDLRAGIDHVSERIIGDVSIIMNVASESHVDRSIEEPGPFVRDNVAIVTGVLDYARRVKPRMFFQMSTDEVYGPAPDGYASREWDVIAPSNPYSASKAAQEAIAFSYWRTYGVPVVITNCYDLDTRVMTDQGFKGQDELKAGDRVWTLDEGENLVLETVQRTVRMPGDGRMIRIKANGASQLVTRNHRMMIRRAVGSPRRWQGIEEVTAESLLTMKGRVRIPRTGAWSGSTDPVFRPYEHVAPETCRSGKRLPDEMPTEQVAAIFGWFISEGCTSGTTVRFGAGSAQQQETIFGLLAGLDGDPYVNSRAVCVANGHLAALMDLSGQGAENKIIPQFIRDLDPKYLRTFFHAMIDGDGTWYGAGAVYYTKSWTLAQQMCEVGMKLGYSARISTRETWNPRKTAKSESWIVRMSSSAGEVERRNVTEENYDGDVWCLSVPSGRVFVERNGVVSLSGQTMNIIGEMQDSEKFIPKTIKAVLSGTPMTVHCDSEGRPGSRFYLHARNLADAWLWLVLNERLTWELQQYPDGSSRPSRFNIVGEREVNNIEMVNMIAGYVGRPVGVELIDFHGTRPGHDRRYALDGSKLQEIGWVPPVPLESSLKKTVEWTLAHPEWLAG